ncbi:MAG: hypothetical protein WCC22_12625, partial [Terriglobales bacterium]
LLKNSLQGVSTTEFARKLLNVRPPKALKFNEITASVPFSTATGDSTHDQSLASPDSWSSHPHRTRAHCSASRASVTLVTLGAMTQVHSPTGPGYHGHSWRDIP